MEGRSKKSKKRGYCSFFFGSSNEDEVVDQETINNPPPVMRLPATTIPTTITQSTTTTMTTTTSSVAIVTPAPTTTTSITIATPVPKMYVAPTHKDAITIPKPTLVTVTMDSSLKRTEDSKTISLNPSPPLEKQLSDQKEQTTNEQKILVLSATLPAPPPLSTSAWLWKGFKEKVLRFQEDDLLIYRSKYLLYLARLYQLYQSASYASNAFLAVHMQVDDGKELSRDSIIWGSVAASIAFILAQQGWGAATDVLTNIQKTQLKNKEKIELESKKTDANKYSQLDRDICRKKDNEDLHETVSFLHEIGAYEVGGKTTLSDFMNGRLIISTDDQRKFLLLKRNSKIEKSIVPDPTRDASRGLRRRF